MPTISLMFDDLLELMGCTSEGEVIEFESAGEIKRIDRASFLESISMLGSDIGKCEGNDLEIEFFPNRPDLYSVEGVARAMKAFLEIEPGLVKYPVKESDITMRVDPSVRDVRPHIGAALIKGVTMTDPLIQSVMGIQEKLHLTLGRRRVKVAIGVHDFDHVKPPFTYKAIDPEGITFVPLDMEVEMDLDDILREHDKGREYAFTLERFSRFPIIIDRNWDVLSFPPIINGELTAVTENTTNIFLDVTGEDKDCVYYALNIMTTMLAERGGEIYRVNVEYPDHAETLPELASRDINLGVKDTNEWLGTAFDAKSIVHNLNKMGYDCHLTSEGEIDVDIPAYRADILHPVDLMEDVAIGYGYDRLEPRLPESMTFGVVRELEGVSDDIRHFFVGQGFLEVMTLALSNDDDEFRNVGLPVTERVIIKNPITREHTTVRVWLLPSLLRILKANQHRDLPQSIFEIGDAVPKVENVRKVAGVSIHRKASFTEIKGIVKSFLRAMDIGDYEFEAREHPTFTEGRQAAVIVDGEDVGLFGELHPRTITRFDLSNPVVGFEFFVEVLGKFSGKR